MNREEWRIEAERLNNAPTKSVYQAMTCPEGHRFNFVMKFDPPIPHLEASRRLKGIIEHRYEEIMNLHQCERA